MGRADRIPNRAVMSTHRWIPRAVPILGLTDRHLAAVPASARTAAVGFRLASHSCRDRMAVNLAAHQHSPHDARNRLPPRPDRRLSVARPRHPASASSAGDATPGPIAPTSRLAGSSRSRNQRAIPVQSGAACSQLAPAQAGVSRGVLQHHLCRWISPEQPWTKAWRRCEWFDLSRLGSIRSSHLPRVGH